jgi:hypothetical protein
MPRLGASTFAVQKSPTVYLEEEMKAFIFPNSPHLLWPLFLPETPYLQERRRRKITRHIIIIEIRKSSRKKQIREIGMFSS